MTRKVYSIRKLFLEHSAWVGAVLVLGLQGRLNAAPLISNVQVAVYESSAVVTWTTDVPATSQVLEADIANYPAVDQQFPHPLDANLVTQHQEVMTNLYPSTTYGYYVASQDAGGNLTTNQNASNIAEFTTLPINYSAPTSYRIDVTGAHNIFAGSDLYVGLYYLSLAGPTGQVLTFDPIVGLPNGTKTIYFVGSSVPDDTYPGDTSSGVGDNMSFGLRITFPSNVSVGSYSLTLGFTLNGVTQTINYPLNINPAAPSLATPTLGPIPTIPVLQQWEDNMINLGQKYCNGQTYSFGWQGDVWYYDGGRVYQQIGDYTLNHAIWEPCAQNVLQQYGAQVLTGSLADPNYPQAGVVSWAKFPHGLAMDYWRNKTPQSLQAVERLSASMDNFILRGGVSPGSIRETAYQLNAIVKTEQLGKPQGFFKTWAVDMLIGQFDQLFVSAPYQQLEGYYFDGIGSEALIQYFEETVASGTPDWRIPPVIKSMLDWVWANDWYPQTSQMAYQSMEVPPVLDTSLLNLITPAYAWYWKMTGDPTYLQRGDTLFSHTFDTAIDFSGKIFSQNYKWSFDYLRYRTGLAQAASDPSSSDLVNLPTIQNFQVSVPMVDAGQSVTLSWNVQNANSVNIVPSVSAQALPTTGSVTITPTQTTKYLLTATNQTGSVLTGAPEIEVAQACAPPGNGILTACYYTDLNFTNELLTRPESFINIWASPINSGGSARWEGNMPFPGGLMAFSLYYTGKARLLVDGVPVINGWNNNYGAIDMTQCASISSGPHEMTVEYINNEGNSAHVIFSSSSVTACPYTAPATPTGLTAQYDPNYGNGVIDLSWNQNNDPYAAGYYIYRSIGAAFTRITMSPVLGPTYGDAVTVGTNYWYEVSEVNTSGQESAVSSPPVSPTHIPYPGGAAPPPTTSAVSLNVNVYPNPWRADKNATRQITFSGLTTGTDIKIFTVSGRMVKEINGDGPSLMWDLTNASGENVASGIYVYLITDHQGDKVRGKLAVIH